ncbi:hypothetical protein CLOM_g4841, partial [Closterium sp. NIES-68]
LDAHAIRYVSEKAHAARGAAPRQEGRGAGRQRTREGSGKPTGRGEEIAGGDKENRQDRQPGSSTGAGSGVGTGEGQIEKLHKSKAQIRGISTHAQVAQANVTVAGAMRSAGTVMGNVNKQMDVASAARMAADFQRESAKMDHVQDMVGGALDDALDSSDTEEEADDITNQILDEIGIDTSAQLSSVPAKRLPAAAAAQGETSRAQAAWQEEEEDDLQRRFAALHSR